MKINIFTHEDWYEYDLTKHQIQVVDGDLYVRALPGSIYDSALLVALFAKGEWKRVDFERGLGTPSV